MLDLKNRLVKIKKTKEFTNFLNKNKDSYLCSFVFLEDDLYFGFYSPKEDKITSFIEKEGKISEEKGEVFKKKEANVRKLNLDYVKINLKKALKIVEGLKYKKYTSENVNKKIIILQDLQDFGLIWNITLITNSFNIINIKLNALDGKVISDKISPVLSFKK